MASLSIVSQKASQASNNTDLNTGTGTGSAEATQEFRPTPLEDKIYSMLDSKSVKNLRAVDATFDRDDRALGDAIAQSERELKKYDDMGFLGRLLHPDKADAILAQEQKILDRGEEIRAKLEADGIISETACEEIKHTGKLTQNFGMSEAAPPPRSSIVHSFDIYPEHPGDELIVREDGPITSQFISALNEGKANSPVVGTDFHSAVASAVSVLHQCFGAYNPNEATVFPANTSYDADREVLLKEGPTGLIGDFAVHPIDTWDFMSKVFRDKAAAARETYAVRNPDEMGWNSLDCAQQAPLVSLALNKLGNFPHQLCDGELYFDVDAITSENSGNHCFIFIPPSTAGNDLGGIVEATAKDPEHALKTIVGTEIVHGRSFWVTQDGHYYHKNGDDTETVTD